MKLRLYACFIILLFASCEITERWQYEPGVEITSGYSNHVLADGNGTLFTQHANIRISDPELREISAYHVLILTTERHFGVRGSGTTRDRLLTVSTVELVNATVEPKLVLELKFVFDGKEKIFTFDDRSYSTAENNMFVLRIDRDSNKHLTPLQAALHTPATSEEVLAKFKEVSDDPEVQAVKLAD